MEIKTYLRDQVTVVTLTGRLDGTSSTPAYEKISPLVTADCRIVLDMEACDYISSAGLRTIMMLGKLFKKADGWGVIANLSPDVKEVMEMTGFDKIFQCFDTLEEAVDAVGQAKERD